MLTGLPAQPWSRPDPQGHLIISLAPNGFIPLHSSYLCSLVTATWGFSVRLSHHALLKRFSVPGGEQATASRRLWQSLLCTHMGKMLSTEDAISLPSSIPLFIPIFPPSFFLPPSHFVTFSSSHMSFLPSLHPAFLLPSQPVCSYLALFILLPQCFQFSHITIGNT